MGRLAGEADRDHVAPPVAVDVVDPVEEVVGVARGLERARLADLEALPEGGAAVPVPAGDQIDLPVVVQIAERTALGAEGDVESRGGPLVPRRQEAGRGRGGEDDGEDEGEHGAQGF